MSKRQRHPRSRDQPARGQSKHLRPNQEWTSVTTMMMNPEATRHHSMSRTISCSAWSLAPLTLEPVAHQLRWHRRLTREEEHEALLFQTLQKRKVEQACIFFQHPSTFHFVDTGPRDVLTLWMAGLGSSSKLNKSDSSHRSGRDSPSSSTGSQDDLSERPTSRQEGQRRVFHNRE